MNILVLCSIVLVVLLAAEQLYFKIADKYNIIDKPNERSSHSTIVLRGGGVVFTISMIVWAIMMVAQNNDIVPYLPFLGGLVLIAGVSFWDDVHSLPDSVRPVAQFVAMALMFWSNGAPLRGWLAFAACGAGFYFPKGTSGSVECGGGPSWQGCSRKVWNKVKC